LKNRNIGLAAVFVLLFALTFYLRHEDEATPNRENANLMRVESVPSPTTSQVPKPASPANSKPVQVFSPPTVEDIRAQALNDPEATPPSIIRFAAALDEKMKVANSSEENARKFFTELESCVLNSHNKVAESAKTLCLSEADALSKRYPGLHSAYQNLEDRADARVIQFKKLTDLSP